MVVESYVVKKEKNIIESYYDADFNYHEISSQKKKTVIEFETPYLYESDVSMLLALFSDGKAEFNYYDTNTQEYEIGTFYSPDKLDLKLHRARGTTTIYKPLKITLNGE